MSQDMRKPGCCLCNKACENPYSPLRFCFSPNLSQSELIRKLFPALCTTAGKYLSSVLCCHSLSETVYPLCVSLLRLEGSLHFFHSIQKTKLVLIFYILCTGLVQALFVNGDINPQYRLLLYIKITILVNKKLIILVFNLIIYYNYTIYCVMVLY